MSQDNRGWLHPNIAWSWGEVPVMPVVEQPPLTTGYRAIVLIDGKLHQIPDELIGTGLIPLTLWRGQIVEYDLTKFLQAGELGELLIFEDGKLQTLPWDGELII